MAIDYNAALKACDPDTTVTKEELEQVIDSVHKGFFPDLSHEDIAINSECADALIAAVRRRIGLELPRHIILKSLLKIAQMTPNVALQRTWPAAVFSRAKLTLGGPVR